METMGIASKTGRMTIKMINSAIDTAVLIVILLLVAIGCYALWDSDQVHQSASSEQYERFKPTAENLGLTFDELKVVNPDVFAWLTVYGTHIDYPIVQGEDNMRYVNTNAEGNYSLSGAIFLDYNCCRDFTDFNSILYGHHMEKNAMFGEIGNFSDKEYFDARKYGMLYFNGKEHGLEFFAFIHADAYDKTVYRTNLEREEDKQEYLYRLYDLAVHTRDIRITTDDRIVLLNTCSHFSTNGRDILIGKITDDVFEDPFWVDVPVRERTIFAIDVPLGFLMTTPIWVKLVIIIIPLIALILMVTVMIKRRRRWVKF